MRLVALLFAIGFSSALAVETTSPGSTPWASDNRSSRNTNCAMLMSVTATMTTTVVPRCKGFEIQIVSGASIRFNSQGGPVTPSSGGLRLTTGATYSEPNETTTRISAVVTDGSSAIIVIVPKY